MIIEDAHLILELRQALKAIETARKDMMVASRIAILMERFEKKIREYAVIRLAEIFHLPSSEMTEELSFGIDLKPSFVSDFRRNEIDKVNDDIHDVADKIINNEFKSGRLIIQTVGD